MPQRETDVAKRAPRNTSKKVPKLTLNKQEEPRKPWLVRLVKAPGLLAAIWPLLLVVGGYIAWTQWGVERVGQQFYGLDESSITLTTAPEYIRRNIVAEVYRSHELDKLSLLDRKTTSTISEAFRSHPWVEEVMRVEKRNSGVRVQVRYRQPVAAVWIEKSQYPGLEGPVLFFIDSEGVLLPTEDFSQTDAEQYLRIVVPGTYPSAKFPGVAFGDRRVVAAASIVKLVEPFRERLDLHYIELANPNREFNEAWRYELVNKNQDRYIWGSPPGEELPGESTAEQKIALLAASAGPPQDLRVTSVSGVRSN